MFAENSGRLYGKSRSQQGSGGFPALFVEILEGIVYNRKIYREEEYEKL
jgi:hypothetical protein